jgi:hypothetical protein
MQKSEAIINHFYVWRGYLFPQGISRIEKERQRGPGSRRPPLH